MITYPEFESISIKLAGSSEAQRNETYKHIRDFAKEQPDQFKQFLSEFPLNEDSALFEVYEALGDKGDLFNQLIISEVERLLIASSDSSTRSYPSLALGGLYSVKDFKTKRRIQKKILEYYDSEFINTRRSVISLIAGSNLFVDDKNQAPSMLKNKVKKLADDSDWQVRVLASKFLNQKLRVLDTIRVRLFGIFSW